MKIEARNLTFGYIKKPLSFSAVNFTIANGSKVLLLSPEDNGKTTFLSVVCGLEKMLMGDVFYDGKSLRDVGSAGINSSLILNPPVLINSKSVLDNLLHSCVVTEEKRLGKGLKNKECKNIKSAKSGEILQKIAHFLPNIKPKCKISKLTSDEKSQVSLLRSLLKNPQNVFIDDVDKIKDLSLVKELLHDKTAIMTASQVKDFDIKFDKIFYLSLGKFYEYKSLEEMKNERVDLSAAYMFNCLIKIDAKITLNESGYFVSVGEEKIKLPDRYLKSLEKLQMELYDESDIVICLTAEKENLTSFIYDGLVNIYDKLTQEKIY